MQFRAGEAVYTSNGERAGELVRVVLDPRSRDVTHIIVRQGLVASTDRVVPIEWVAAAEAGGIRLRPDSGKVNELPQYMEEQYVVADERGLREEVNRPAVQRTANLPTIESSLPAVFWYPPPALGYGGTTYVPTPALGENPSEPIQAVDVRSNIPDEAVALKEGARVYSADGHHVGNVERLFTEPGSNRVTHLMLSRGLLFKSHKVVPMDWVADVAEDDVRLAVGSSLLQSLRDYTDEPAKRR
jgi:sporulation protein YlmC with PRC-barrel domain